MRNAWSPPGTHELVAALAQLGSADRRRPTSRLAVARRRVGSRLAPVERRLRALREWRGLAVVRWRGGRLGSSLGLAAMVMLPGALTVYLSFKGGGFFAGTTGIAALVVSLVLVLRLTLAEEPFEGLSPPLALVTGALALFAVWTLVSAWWSGAPARALLEFDRVLLYTLTAVLFGSLRGSPARLRWMVRALAAGIFSVCVVGLITRVAADLWPIAPNLVERRLSYPLTYWNALGLLAALGVVLCLHLASDEREPRPARVLAAGALPPLAATLLLTFSRGAIAVCVLGVLAYALLGRPRGLATALLVAAPTTAIAAVATYDADLLGTSRFASRVAVEQGHTAARAIVLCSIAALIGRVLLLPVDRWLVRLRLPSAARRPVLAATSAIALAAVVATVLALDAPERLAHQYDRFVEGSTVRQASTARERLTDVANNGRLDFWRVALRASRTSLFKGTGAGTYQLLWARGRPDGSPATDGHSLYVEVLAELGMVGLALVMVAILAVLLPLALLARGPDRALYAGILAAGVTWAVHAGVDWDWEMPAVSLPFFALGGAALAASKPRLGAPGRTPRLFVACAVLLLAVTPALIALSQARLNDSVAAMKRGECARAIDNALGSLSALRVRPEPYEVLGYCDARVPGFGRLGARMMEQAVRRDPDNWEFRYGLALVRGAARLDPRSAARAARRLNPRDPLARQVVERFATKDPEKWERRARAAHLPFAD